MTNPVEVAFLLDCLLMLATRALSANDWKCVFLENVENAPVPLDASAQLHCFYHEDARMHNSEISEEGRS